jgi:serine/threonine protein kinase
VTETVLAGRYRLVRPLGRGGQGTVYEGCDAKVHRRIAVKVLTVSPADATARRRMLHGRFEREARALAGLVHDNIVTLHDRDEHEGVPFLVLEYVTGQSLAARLAEHGPLPVSEAADWTAQTARGLAAAHAAGIAHRDVKPSNLLLSAERTVKICDFGLVTRLAPEAAGLTVRGGVLGSPGFMSPEQAAGEPGDERSDVFSLGVTLYALLAGASPYAAAEPLHAAALCLGPPPEPIRRRRTGVPAALADLLAAALARDPAERPAIDEVLAALAPPPGGDTAVPAPPAAVRDAPRPRRPSQEEVAREVAAEREIPTGAAADPAADPAANPVSDAAADPAPGDLTARYWPRLEEAERLLAERKFKESDAAFGRIVGELNDAAATDHPAFFAALFGRVRALAGLGRAVEARRRMARLPDRASRALGPDHPLARAIARHHT